MAFEEEFGSEISDSEAEKILTVGNAIKFIEVKLVKKLSIMRHDKESIMVYVIVLLVLEKQL